MRKWKPPGTGLLSFLVQPILISSLLSRVSQVWSCPWPHPWNSSCPSALAILVISASVPLPPANTLTLPIPSQLLRLLLLQMWLSFLCQLALQTVFISSPSLGFSTFCHLLPPPTAPPVLLSQRQWWCRPRGHWLVLGLPPRDHTLHCHQPCFPPAVPSIPFLTLSLLCWFSLLCLNIMENIQVWTWFFFLANLIHTDGLSGLPCSDNFKRFVFLDVYLHILQSYVFSYVLDLSKGCSTSSSWTTKINMNSTFSPTPMPPLSPLSWSRQLLFIESPKLHILDPMSTPRFHPFYPTSPVNFIWLFILYSIPTLQYFSLRISDISLNYDNRFLINTNPLTFACCLFLFHSSYKRCLSKSLPCWKTWNSFSA